MKTPSHSPILERFIGRRFGFLPRERHALRAALIPFLRIEQFARFFLGHPTRHSRSIGLIGALASRRGFRLIVTGLGLAGARRLLRGRWLLDNIASMPLVFPGLVLGLAIMVCYLSMDIGIYGTLWIMFIAYLTRFLPYGMRYNSAAMLAIHKELEESAAMSGASWSMSFRRIVLPLLKPGLVAGFIYVTVVSIRELSSSILLYSPGTEVVSIMIWELWQNGQYVELSALGVMLILVLFCLVMLAQLFARQFGIAEA